MPTFAVHIKVSGPVRDVADGARFDGAYSQCFVSAADAHTAQQRAIEALQSEPRYRQLKLLGGIGPPPTEVDEVRQVRWYERFCGGAAFVLYRDSPPSGR